ncbi:hypothetical protein BGZ65_011335, partial [Modicella reniformis]
TPPSVTSSDDFTLSSSLPRSRYDHGLKSSLSPVDLADASTFYIDPSSLSTYKYLADSINIAQLYLGYVEELAWSSVNRTRNAPRTVYVASKSDVVQVCAAFDQQLSGGEDPDVDVYTKELKAIKLLYEML